MKMEPFANNVEATRAVQAFARENWHKLPKQVQDEIARHDGPGSSTADLVCGVAEALYATRKKAGVGNKAGRELIGKLAAFADGDNGWHRLRGGRGAAIRKAMLRDNGEAPPEGAQWPDEAADPAPDPRFAEPAPTPSSFMDG